MTDRKYAIDLLTEAEVRFRDWTGLEDDAERHELERRLSLARRYAVPLTGEMADAFVEAERRIGELVAEGSLAELEERRRSAAEACALVRERLSEEPAAVPKPRPALPLAETLPWPLGRFLVADPF